MTKGRKITELLGMADAGDVEFSALEDALAAAEAAGVEYRMRCLAVWRELQVRDPILADEIRALGCEDEVAAVWLCQPLASGRPPIAIFAEGGREELLGLLRRMTHNQRR